MKASSLFPFSQGTRVNSWPFGRLLPAETRRFPANRYSFSELLLSFVIPRKDVKPIAKVLLHEFGSLPEVFDTPMVRLPKTLSVGPVIDRVYPIQAAEEAHPAMKENRHFGKIVLTWE
jgi:DNA repair protein RadC